MVGKLVTGLKDVAGVVVGTLLLVGRLNVDTLVGVRFGCDSPPLGPWCGGEP